MKYILSICFVFLLSVGKAVGGEMGGFSITLATGVFLSECQFHCDERLHVVDGDLDYSLSNHEESLEHPPINKQLSLDAPIWRELVAQIDFESFKQLANKRCLDCADHGTEWFEVTINNASHRVEYDYGANLNVPLLEKLRSLRQKYTHREPD